MLQKHGVEYNILTTVNRVNGDYPLEVYRFLRDEAGTDWMQFIPVVERINADGRTLYQEGTTVSERSVLPEQFGRFLSAIFDEWVRHDVGHIFVQTFEAALSNWLGWAIQACASSTRPAARGWPSSTMVIFTRATTLSSRTTSWATSRRQHLIELVASPQQVKFGQDKRDTLPRYCLECDVRFACHGECPKNRFIETPDGEPMA